MLAGDHERDEFGGVGGTGAQLGELLVAVEALLFQLIDVVDLSHGGDSKTTEVGVHHDRLRIRVADDTDTGVALEFTQIVGKLRPEVGVLNIMNGTAE